MQTFLPYPSFRDSVRALDSDRVWKQCVEARQMLEALTDPTYGWQRHPAVRMWRGYSGALYRYGIQALYECHRRGIFIHDEMTKLVTLAVNTGILKLESYARNPFWLGHVEFHRSHQSALLRKAHCFYVHKFPGVPNNLPYVWPNPLTNNDGNYQLKIRLFK